MHLCHVLNLDFHFYALKIIECPRKYKGVLDTTLFYSFLKLIYYLRHFLLLYCYGREVLICLFITTNQNGKSCKAN